MGLDTGRAFLAFALAVTAFHHLPTVEKLGLGIAFDLVAPLVVVGAAAALLTAAEAPRLPLVVGIVAAILYVEGHGIHLAANDIWSQGMLGRVESRVYFWDERFGHVEWHLGWLGLLLAFCLAERARPGIAAAGPVLTAAVPPLGFTLFSSMVEGQTWPLMLAAGLGFFVWAVAAPRPLLVRCAGAFGFATLLLAGWAFWQGGVPEFTDVWGT